MEPPPTELNPRPRNQHFMTFSRTETCPPSDVSDRHADASQVYAVENSKDHLKSADVRDCWHRQWRPLYMMLFNHILVFLASWFSIISRMSSVCLIHFPLYFSHCISCVLTTFHLLNEEDDDDVFFRFSTQFQNRRMVRQLSGLYST